MSYHNTVLSLNPDGTSLRSYESALQDGGSKVISVFSAIEARFEIEMGRCGVFLTSYITPPVIYGDLARLFRRSCPDGLIIFITAHHEDKISAADILLADIVLSDEDEPQAIVQCIRAKREKKAS